MNMELDYANSGSEPLSRRASVVKQITLKPTDNEGAYFYDESIYKLANTISVFAAVLAALAWAVFLFGLFTRKMVGVEMMAVLQIAFFSLISLESLNPSFKALSSLQYVNGYNILERKQYLLVQKYFPLHPRGIYLVPQYLFNFNITSFLFLVPPLVALVCLILKKLCTRMIKRSKRQLTKSRKDL